MNTAKHLLDRATGVLLGQACGDALGVPYESAPLLSADQQPAMTGSGLGDYAPGEWSDDTALAIAVAEGLLVGSSLEEHLERIATRFLAWFNAGPPDIGNQTCAVLTMTHSRLMRGESGASRIRREEAKGYAATHPHSAGNGALMRTSPVALVYSTSGTNAQQRRARSLSSLTRTRWPATRACSGARRSGQPSVGVCVGVVDLDADEDQSGYDGGDGG